MTKVKLFIAASIDGFIARPDGNLDWLNSFPEPETGDYGYTDFLKGIGTIIMGRKTYEVVLSFGVDWPYPGYDTYIVTGNPDFKVSTSDTYILSKQIPEFIYQLKNRTDKDIWLVGGGRLITTFINTDLLDEMIISIIPVILGEGISLFPDKPMETFWTLSKVEQFSTGLVSLTYKKDSR